jgi:hypothetical protein
MDSKPSSAHHALAECYYLDALDFMGRFDVFHEKQQHKAGRIKSFIDLLMACECVLKSHCILSLQYKSIADAYKQVRSYQHNIGKLADAATLLERRDSYTEIAKKLGPFSVELRYSLDAYDAFFPIAHSNKTTKHSFSKTVGCSVWLSRVRQIVQELINAVTPEFSGLVGHDVELIWKHEKQIQYALSNPKKSRTH